MTHRAQRTVPLPLLLAALLAVPGGVGLAQDDTLGGVVRRDAALKINIAVPAAESTGGVRAEAEELVDVVLERWASATDREQFYDDIALLPGVYVPTRHGEVLRPVAQVRDEVLPAHAAIVTPNTTASRNPAGDHTQKRRSARPAFG